ncbi:hypothetical protein THOG11_30042 [Vibrio harveyi]|nr:hypothetical protein TH15OA1_400091 [Vibrio harveyi]CAH1553212.1 hypothetical protein THOD03_180043 [Vibrio harveyi]CAH1570244.1 hypothetical protein THOG11_30042 [Vibrio harveyi]
MARRESPDAAVPDDRLKALIYTQVSRGYLGMDAPTKGDEWGHLLFNFTS